MIIVYFFTGLSSLPKKIQTLPLKLCDNRNIRKSYNSISSTIYILWFPHVMRSIPTMYLCQDHIHAKIIVYCIYCFTLSIYDKQINNIYTEAKIPNMWYLHCIHYTHFFIYMCSEVWDRWWPKQRRVVVCRDIGIGGYWVHEMYAMFNMFLLILRSVWGQLQQNFFISLSLRLLA